MLNLQNSIFSKQALHQGRVNMLVFTVLTVVSLLFAQTTVFYLIYFFWWSALVQLAVDFCFRNRNKNAICESNVKFEFSSLFLMGIYWVLIVTFFGFIAGADNHEIIFANMRVLFFQNWFFNGNLIFILIERILLHKTQQPVTIYLNAFSPNAIVLHISIIVGGILMFFVVKKYPTVFTPENLWGSVIIILPFLLLKVAVNHYTKPNVNIKPQKV